MFLISYDISDNKLRRKLVQILLGYGKRVQYSVFECQIDNKKFGELYKEMLILTDGKEEVSIRCYPIDKISQGKITTIGDPAFISVDSADEDILFI